MGLINRGVVVVKPKQPFLDWLRALPTPATDVSLEELREDCSAYLLPDWEDEEHLQRMLVRCCKDVFVDELRAWCTDESVFPEQRSWPVFCEWFEVESHSMVFNLVQGPLVDEDGA